MIVIAGRLSLLGFVYKPVSWLAGDSRLRQTFSVRIHLVERQYFSPICPSTIISYFRSPEASLSTSASRSIAGSIVFSLDRNKPVTNLIENVWHLLKGQLRKRFTLVEDRPHTEEDLWMAMEEEWEAIDQITIDRLLYSMPNRVTAVISANGGHTKW